MLVVCDLELNGWETLNCKSQMPEVRRGWVRRGTLGMFLKDAVVLEQAGPDQCFPGSWELPQMVLWLDFL